MSGAGGVTTDFAGDERAFRIRLGEIRLIEAKCQTGIGEVCRRLAHGCVVLSKASGAQALLAGLEIRSDDVREVIYQGLVGGGMSSSAATALVRGAIDDRGLPGLLDSLPLALTVLWGTQQQPDIVAGETSDSQTSPN